MSVIDELLQNNETYARSFAGRQLASPPAKKVAVVTCMDARLDPMRMLGLADGDAHVLRNAGGVVTEDVIRSLAISQRLLATEEVLVIHHTDCGALKLRDDEFRRQVQAETGIRPPWAAEGFSDLDEEARQSIRRLEASPFLAAKGMVRAFVYEVETGRLHEVT